MSSRSAANYTLLIAALVLIIGAVAWITLGPESPEEAPLSLPPVPVEDGARLASIDGDVRVKRSGTLEWLDATADLPLQPEDLIRTGTGSSALILFADGTELRVRPDTLMTIVTRRGTRPSKPQVDPRIELGEFNFKTGEEPDTGIESPGGRTIPGRDTEGRIEVSESGETDVQIFKGQAQVEAKGGQVVPLGPNEGVQIDTEGIASPVFSLPEEANVLRPPQLAINRIEVKGNQLYLSGQTEPGVTLTVNGERIVVQNDGSFGEHVVLGADITLVSIRAVSARGATTEQRLPVTAKQQKGG